MKNLRLRFLCWLNDICFKHKIVMASHSVTGNRFCNECSDERRKKRNLKYQIRQLKQDSTIRKITEELNNL